MHYILCVIAFNPMAFLQICPGNTCFVKPSSMRVAVFIQADSLYLIGCVFFGLDVVTASGRWQAT